MAFDLATAKDTVDPAILQRQIQAESGGDPNALSPKGASGLMQLMPATARNPGFDIKPVQDNSPDENLRVGTEYMAALQDKYGDTKTALIAYNWGPGKTDKWLAQGGDPAKLPEETQSYVAKIIPAKFDLSTAKDTPLSSEKQTYYREDTGKTIAAPLGLEGKQLTYLDDTQNNKNETGDYVGFTHVGKFLQDYLVNPVGNFVLDKAQAFAGGVISTKTSLEAGTLRQLGDAQKEVFQNKPYEQMTKAEKVDFIARANTPALATMIFGSIRDQTLQTGWLQRLFTPQKEGLTKAEGMTQAAIALKQENDRFIKEMDLQPHDILGEAFSLAPLVAGSLGVSIATKNPFVAAKVFSDLVKDDTYIEAKEKGWDNVSADKISSLNGAIQGAMQFVGLNYFLKAAQFSQPLARMAVRMGSDAVAFMTQTGANEVITQMSGLHPKDVQGAFERIGHAGFLGLIVGSASHDTLEAMRQVGKKENIPEPVVDKMHETMEENKPAIEQELTQIVQDQSSPIRSDPKTEAQTQKTFKEFLEFKDIDTSHLSEAEREIIGDTTQRAVDRIGPEKVDFTPQISVKRQPMTLRAFIRKLGGISDDGGDLAYMGLDKNPAFKGVINNKKGLPPDRVRELAQEAGYLKQDDPNAPSESTIQDLYDAISREIAGENVYRAEDVTQALAHEESKTQADFFQEAQNTYDQAKSKGIDLTKDEAIDVTHLIRGGEDFQDAIDTVLEAGAQQRESQIAEGDIKGKNKKIFSLNEVIAAVRKSFKRAQSATKKDVKNVQAELIKALDESGLEANDKAKFIKTIKNIQTAKQLQKQAPDIEARVMELLDAQQRRETIEAIRKTVAKVKKSKVIAVDFAKQIEALFNEIDTKQRRPETLETLQKTIDYMNKNPDAKMPPRVLKKLEVLNKKRLENISTEELGQIYEDLQNLIKQGKTKLELIKAKQERIKAERIAQLQADSVPLNTKPLKRAPIGERLSFMERLKNRFADTLNRAGRVGTATNPMDVFFDMLDGNKNYKGANFKIFKETADKGFHRYLDMKDGITREVKDLTDKLGLTAENFERIGVYAASKQEGGVEKLLETGITQHEIDNLTLTDPEMQMYQLMRNKLDSMLPDIKEVMRTVYNQDVEAVKDYFPFMSDFEAMKDFEVQDMIGDNVPTVGRKKNVEKGFTIPRTLGAQKIRIDALGVFLKHVDNASYLVELGGDIRSLGELATSKEYADAVGDVGQEMVVDWVNLLARKGASQGRIAALDAFRRNAGLAVLGFKLSSAAVQLTSLADGAAIIGADYVSRGTMHVASKEWRQFLFDNMPELRDRVGDDPNYLDMGGNGIVSKVQDAGFYVLKKLDLFAAASIAAGAYEKAVHENGGTVDLSNPDPQALVDAQLMLRRTQSSPFAKDAPPILTQGELTGNVSVDKLLLQFQSFMLNRWSIIKHDMWTAGIKEGRTAQALNIATWILLATAAETGIREGIRAGISALAGDDKKKQTTFTHDFAINTLQNVPFVSQGVSAVEYGSVPVPSLSIMVQGFNELGVAGKSKQPQTKIKHYENAAAILAGTTFGIPGTMQGVQINNKIQRTGGVSSKRKPLNP